MSRAAKEWAIKARFELLTKLGGKCVECREKDFEKLTFDHIYGKDWETTGKSTDQRMGRYVKEARQGLLQVLCHVCNSRRGCPKAKRDRERGRILWRLDAKCCGCGEVYKPDLQLVHSDPDWKPDESLSPDEIVEAYRTEIAIGALSVLCNACLSKPVHDPF